MWRSAIQDTVLGLAEIGSNQLLHFDEDVLVYCEKLSGCCVAIHISDLEKTLYCHPNASGLRFSLESPSKEVDATISGRVMALVNLSLQNDKIATSIKERVEISGNAQVAQQFQKIITELDIDWEEQISKLTGDVAAVRITRTIKSVHQWFKNTLESSILDIRDYAQHEQQLTPTAYEMEDFSAQVTTLRNDVDRFEAKLKLLEQRLQH